MKHYLEEAASVLAEVKSSENGLTSAEAEKRLAENGKNKLKEAEKDSLFKKFINSLADPMIIMLLVAAAIQGVVAVIEAGGKPGIKDFADVLVILVVVIINTVMSLVQESKSEAAMDALMEMTAATSHVIRDGEVVTVKSEDLCVGDVIVLEAGDAVPADCRILESHSIKAEEAALTGESVPVNKIIDVLMCRDENTEVPLGDRKNMLYSGSTIVYGRGKAVVTAVGMDTEMGKIADALSQAEQEQTPLQIKMAELSTFLTKLVIGISVLVFVVGIVESLIIANKNGEPFTWALVGNTSLNTFISAIALAVAAIPEGLPAVVTIILSIGVTAMSKRQALIRKLTAVETLGCTQIICSDKTGTLTQNKMTVVDHYGDDENLLATGMALCCDANIDAAGVVTGEPTEAALVAYANSISLNKNDLVSVNPRIGEAPFDSGRKMMSTVHQTPDGILQFTKGAPDVVLKKCKFALINGETVPMTDEILQNIAADNKRMADKALRVLALALKKYDSAPGDYEPEALEFDLVFVGLTGMIDPIRPEVKDAIEECRLAGVPPVTITGDRKDTAVASGRELGIVSDPSQAILGAELDKFSDEELIEEVTKYSVYARVQPEHKSRIVRAWKARGMVTAMTGDGVNDAPSIKAADIGIGMGITGTDVTKGVSDMVLADDNFATIVNAVEEGRKIYDNVCKVLQFQLSTNLSEVIIMFFASILHFNILDAVHLLWINMVTDSLPGLALGMEKAEGNLMKRKPRLTTDGIFSNGAGADMVWQGIYLALIEIAAYVIGFRLDAGSFSGLFFAGETTDINLILARVNAMAMAFLVVNFSEMMCAINMRSRTGSLFSKEMFKNMNWWLVGAFVVTSFLSLLAIYSPLNSIFLQADLPADFIGMYSPVSFKWIGEGFDLRELAISVALALSTIPVFEIGKGIRRKINSKKDI
ncbi:MAG: calcium-translocating P-type ATPase, PMCA-type [Clostridia bacterium]|nr:calcium-translocating P-type ATPase, PMCA-type [Clostridia bacterium]